jgi:hypothetical protein
MAIIASSTIVTLTGLATTKVGPWHLTSIA